MIDVKLKHCVCDRGRWYVRVPGHRKIRIREERYDAEGRLRQQFVAAYHAAFNSLEAAPQTPREETFHWLTDKHYRSSEFQGLDKLTQADRRSVLERFCKTAGPLPYKQFRKQDVEASRDKRRDKPAAADKLVRHLRSLFDWAIENKHATLNPCISVKKIYETEGYHTWTAPEIALYRARYPVGTKARLALEIFLNIGARISDAARIGRQHEIEGRLRFVAWKGRNKSRTRRTIEVPIRSDLRLALENTPTGALTYIVNEYGRPYTIKGLGNKMREWCTAAGLPHCSAHGLRKASAVAFAESGATASELNAIFGWSKLETAEIYIRAANQRKMTANAFARLDDYRDRKSVSLSVPKNGHETNGKK